MKKLTILSLLTITALLCIISCNKEIAVNGVTIDKSELSIIKGETAVLTATITPDNATDKTVLWSSDNNSIASVDENGVVTAINTGECNITAMSGTVSGSCKVIVLGIPVDHITLDKTEVELICGETVQLNATVLPEDAEDKTVTWTSSDNEIATVNETGLVTSHNAGTATITATSGDVSAECTVTVIKKPAVGDYYYSDGTFSEDLDNSKTPIGIIFWIGDPSTEDDAMKNEHSECKNGLVVSIKETASIAWQTECWTFQSPVTRWLEENCEDYKGIMISQKTDEEINCKVGYNNTKAIEFFNNAEENKAYPVTVVEALKEYQNSNATPEHTSGWYLPSPKELSLLCSGEIEGSIAEISNDADNKALVNEKLAKVSGANQLANALYWTSSETNTLFAYSIHFETGFVNFINKTRKDVNARYILAF